MMMMMPLLLLLLLLLLLASTLLLVVPCPSATARTVFPAGSPYNVEATVQIQGTFEAYGPVRCRFGSQMGGLGDFVNESYVTCVKPPFSDEVSSWGSSSGLDAHSVPRSLLAACPLRSDQSDV